MTYDTFLTPQNILDSARSEAISSSSSQVTALGDTQMIEFVHTLNSDFILTAHTEHHAKGWSWLRKTGNLKTFKHNSLLDSISEGDPIFELKDASNFEDSGRSVIETNKGAMDFVDHESKAANVLTVSTTSGAEVISIDHATDRVHQMYATPSDYGRIHRLWVGAQPFDFEKFNLAFPRYRRFTTYGGYFLFPRGMYQADVSFLYEKKHRNITALDSPTDIPREFLRYAIEMTLTHVFMIKRKRADMPTSMQLAQIALEKALMFDATESSSNSIHLR